MKKRVKSINEFKRLKHGYRAWKEKNLEWDVGKEYYIHSPVKGEFIRHVFMGEPSIETVEQYIKEETVYFKI
jgi:hypothetical protein